MPPAVAQEPIVTRQRESSRTSLTRCASSGVAMEPSTREMSYGPGMISRDASGKFAILTDPAMASSSLSQFSSVSWQPSQEENFHTARVGLAGCVAGMGYHSSLIVSHRATSE